VLPGAIEANPCRRDQPRLDGESRDVNRHDCGKSWLFGRKMPEWGERDGPDRPEIGKSDTDQTPPRLGQTGWLAATAVVSLPRFE
jgi:hypothetical protein